jgi:hypothetical protein
VKSASVVAFVVSDRLVSVDWSRALDNAIVITGERDCSESPWKFREHFEAFVKGDLKEKAGAHSQ